MPTVVFPYTKKGEENARAAAKEYSGKYVSGNKGGVGAMAGFISSTKSKGKTRSKKKE